MTEDRLRKVLELERSRRFSDRAVTAGLDSFIRNVLAQESARLDGEVCARLQQLPAAGYRSLTPARRKAWLEATLDALKPGGAKSTATNAATRPAAKRAGPARAARPEQHRLAPSQPRRFSPGELEGLGVEAPIYAIKRVTFALTVKLEKLGLRTVKDVLLFFPRRHVDYGEPVPVSSLEPGREQTVRVHVWSAKERQYGFRMRSTEATVGDSSGMLRCVWFNQPWIAKQLPVNAEIVLAGRVTLRDGRPQLENPEWEPYSTELMHTGRLVPIYPLTTGLQHRTLRRIIREAIDNFGARLEDPLPEEMRERLGLAGLRDAVVEMHYPTDKASLERARRRLAFDELLPIQLTMLLRRRMFQRSAPAEPLPLTAGARARFEASLPFTLTGAQQRVMFDVLTDMGRPLPMSRLVQGDVGSGKTVIAAAALLAAVEHGKQAVMMAPTEILAEQHYRTLTQLLTVADAIGPATSPVLGRPLRIALLTGSARSRERRALHDQLARGEIDIACGTHALIQDGVRFRDLGAAVVDEQHRFGVMQRAALRDKGSMAAHTPHMLVMTATPIPRTLALTVYGDLDISVLDELPPGRVPIKTTWVAPEERGDAERFVREQVREGRQAFVICPLVEESDTLDVKSATAEYERLRRDVYPDLRLELLHGRMPQKQKDEVMRRFRAGEADILVSTSVIEVGIDVPNASVMLVEGADRFGLAQLHQFRGRVGRGAEQSYCLLLADDPGEEARQRLELMERSSDGFLLAEADMEMRGPGQFFGTKQSGLPGLRVAKLSDVALIELSRNEAARLLDADPGLTRPAHHDLNRRVSVLLDSVVDEEH